MRYIPTSIFIFLLLSGASSCGVNQSVLKSNIASSEKTSNIERPSNSLEKDLEAMRTADFNFIFVLRRKDGSELDGEDKSFVKQSTADANRRTLSDDGKAVIVGSNYKLSAETMMKLYQRFAVDDYSKSDNEINKSNPNK